MDVTTLLPILLIGVVFYLLIMRPARARQKKQQELLSSVGVGAKVMTTSGIYGTIVGLEDDDVQLEIAPGIVIKIVRGAIASTQSEPALPTEPADDAPEAVSPPVAADKPVFSDKPDEGTSA